MAFRIAVSGLRAATADLDVTGNNIANANTTGFKQSRVQFADVYAVSNLGTSQDAIGQGVQLAAVAQQFNQGNIAFTDNNLDLDYEEGEYILAARGCNVQRISRLRGNIVDTLTVCGGSASEAIATRRAAMPAISRALRGAASSPARPGSRS